MIAKKKLGSANINVEKTISVMNNHAGKKQKVDMKNPSRSIK